MITRGGAASITSTPHARTLARPSGWAIVRRRRARRRAPMPPDPSAYWMLIAVLASTVPLPPALSHRLYRAALELHRDRRDVEKLNGDLALGEVRRLGKDLLLGSISGPAFEALLDTPQGSGTVRFILTRQALEHEGVAGDEPEAAGAGRRMMN